MSLAWVAAQIGAALLAIGSHGIATAQPDVDGVRPIVASVLEASGLDPTERRAFESRFDALARDIATRVGSVRSPERRARRLHRVLHERVFLHYREYADGIEDVIARGEFNCVSSTIVEGLLASSLGLNPTIVPGSHHVFLRMTLPTRVVDVETTARDGFDAHGDAAALARVLWADKLATQDEIALRGARELALYDQRPGVPVPLADGAAFVWHNVAERALARGEGRAAAQSIFVGETRYPGVAAGGESVQTTLSRAFRLDYDAARFDDAYRTAAIGVSLGPSVVSAHDRLIAAAAQRVERLVDVGEVGQAEEVLIDLHRLLGDASKRFERHVLPLVVAAAVRVGDWERADCLADRFGAVELDAVEAGRLRSWVRGRRTEAESSR